MRPVAAIFGVSIAYIYKALIRRRLTGDSGINPTRGHRRRKLWRAAQPFIDRHSLVFLDETGVNTKRRVSTAGRRSASAAATACPSATGRP